MGALVFSFLSKDVVQAAILYILRQSGRFPRFLIFGLLVFFASSIWHDPIVFAQGASPESANVLIGHWRKTTIIFGSVQDTNLVLRPDGIAEKWIVTVSRRTGKTTGRWGIDGRTLMLVFGEGDQASAPYTIHQGKLVFPNIQNNRGFWDRIE